MAVSSVGAGQPKNTYFSSAFRVKEKEMLKGLTGKERREWRKTLINEGLITPTEKELKAMQDAKNHIDNWSAQAGRNSTNKTFGISRGPLKGDLNKTISRKECMKQIHDASGKKSIFKTIKNKVKSAWGFVAKKTKSAFEFIKKQSKKAIEFVKTQSGKAVEFVKTQSRKTVDYVKKHKLASAIVAGALAVAAIVGTILYKTKNSEEV